MSKSLISAPMADPQRHVPNLGDHVIVLANKQRGVVQALHRRLGQGLQYSVEYVIENGTIIESWFRDDEIGPIPTPKKKPTRKA